MTPTNAQSNGARQLIPPSDSACEKARRLDDLHTALLQIGKDAGFPLSYLQNVTPWYNAGKNPEEYEPLRPYAKEQDMLRDLVATVARIGTAEQRDAVRRAVCRYFEIRKEDALEMIGTESEADLVALTLESEREIGEARCATIQALTSQTPESFANAERENEEAESVIDQLGSTLRIVGRKARQGSPVKLPLRWIAS